MGNASGREEDVAAVDGDGADVEDGGGDSSVRSSERGFPPYGSGGANHVRRACSVGVVGGGGGAGSPPGSPGRSLSPRMFVPQVRSRDPAPLSRFACLLVRFIVCFPMLVSLGMWWGALCRCPPDLVRSDRVQCEERARSGGDWHVWMSLKLASDGYQVTNHYVDELSDF